MEFKGIFKAKYTLDRKLTELVVEVELRQRDGLMKPGDGIYYGVAKVNGSPYEDSDLSGSVNAQYSAEAIGIKLLDEHKEKAKAEGKSFRIKRK